MGTFGNVKLIISLNGDGEGSGDQCHESTS